MSNTRVKRPPPDLLKTDETSNQKHSVLAEELIEINKALADLNLLSSENVFELSENIFNYQRSFEDESTRRNSLEEYYRLKEKIAEHEDWLISHKKFDDFYDNLDTSDTFPIITENYKYLFFELYTSEEDDLLLKKLQELCFNNSYHPLIMFSKKLVDVSIYYSTRNEQLFINEGIFEELIFRFTFSESFCEELVNHTLLPAVLHDQIPYNFNIIFDNIYSVLYALTLPENGNEIYWDCSETVNWEFFIRNLNTQIALKNIGLLNYKLETFIRQCKIEEMRNEKQ